MKTVAHKAVNPAAFDFSSNYAEMGGECLRVGSLSFQKKQLTYVFGSLLPQLQSYTESVYRSRIWNQYENTICQGSFTMHQALPLNYTNDCSF